MPTCDLTHETVYYAHSGKGTALVLLHGAASSHLAFPPQLRRLAGWAVYALDLPGHGRSGGAGRQSIAAYAEVVQAFLTRLGVSRWVLLGTSMGGAIAQTLALMEPERTAGLILISSGAKLSVNPKILSDVENNLPAVIESVHKWSWTADAPARLKQASLRFMYSVPAHIYAGDYHACNAFDLTNALHQISPPTLIISGDADRMTPPALSTYLATHIPNASLKTIPGGGHSVILEQAPLVGQIVGMWLDAHC